MSQLAELVRATYVALVRPMGRVDIMTVEAYCHLPDEAVRGTKERLLTRTEVIRVLHKLREGRAARRGC